MTEREGNVCETIIWNKQIRNMDIDLKTTMQWAIEYIKQRKLQIAVPPPDNEFLWPFEIQWRMFQCTLENFYARWTTKHETPQFVWITFLWLRMLPVVYLFELLSFHCQHSMMDLMPHLDELQLLDIASIDLNMVLKKVLIDWYFHRLLVSTPQVQAGFGVVVYGLVPNCFK